MSDSLPQSVYPISANATALLEFSKKDIKYTYSSELLKPCESTIIELRTKWNKKIKKIASCDTTGNFRFRDPRILKDKLKEIEDLLKDDLITEEEFKLLRAKRIQEELDS